MKNKIDDLRNHLFATLEALQDKENPMDIDRRWREKKAAGPDHLQVDCTHLC